MAGLSNTNCKHGFDMGEGCVSCKLITKIEKRIKKESTKYWANPSAKDSYISGMEIVLKMVKK